MSLVFRGNVRYLLNHRIVSCSVPFNMIKRGNEIICYPTNERPAQHILLIDSPFDQIITHDQSNLVIQYSQSKKLTLVSKCLSQISGPNHLIEHLDITTTDLSKIKNFKTENLRSRVLDESSTENIKAMFTL